MKHALVQRPLPRLMFAATMSVPARFSASTFSSALTWELVKLSTHGLLPTPPQRSSEVNLEKTWMARTSASGATPRLGAPSTPIPSPATIPATWVPWEQTAPMVAHGPVSTSALPGPTCSPVPSGAQTGGADARVGDREARLTRDATREERVVDGDAGVEDGDRCAGAGLPGREGPGAAYREGGFVQGGCDRYVLGDADDVRIGVQLLKARLVHAEGDEGQ
ncbi:hypothetical protein ADK34_09985 [Streptomyces viridochromogenes]|uniref:Uncharacterized protein n=1 Tax=Streptomyces viridochromogenes TaxID=1938 RepID=A0A0L8L0Q6_STRVR|nr:hypothetical protein ADK34_09985 [Streptomyces viridochromogenes]